MLPNAFLEFECFVEGAETFYYLVFGSKSQYVEKFVFSSFDSLIYFFRPRYLKWHILMILTHESSVSSFSSKSCFFAVCILKSVRFRNHVFALKTYKISQNWEIWVSSFAYFITLGFPQHDYQFIIVMKCVYFCIKIENLTNYKK